MSPVSRSHGQAHPRFRNEAEGIFRLLEQSGTPAPRTKHREFQSLPTGQRAVDMSFSCPCQGSLIQTGVRSSLLSGLFFSLIRDPLARELSFFARRAMAMGFDGFPSEAAVWLDTRVFRFSSTDQRSKRRPLSLPAARG